MLKNHPLSISRMTYTWLSKERHHHFTKRKREKTKLQNDIIISQNERERKTTWPTQKRHHFRKRHHFCSLRRRHHPLPPRWTSPPYSSSLALPHFADRRFGFSSSVNLTFQFPITSTNPSSSAKSHLQRIPHFCMLIGEEMNPR